jgi:hypothetical protein
MDVLDYAVLSNIFKQADVPVETWVLVSKRLLLQSLQNKPYIRLVLLARSDTSTSWFVPHARCMTAGFREFQPAQEALRDLTIYNSDQLIWHNWPPHLERLCVRKCAIWGHSFGPRPWPSSLRRLELDHCVYLTNLDALWPSTLTHLQIRDCEQLMQLPGTWPTQLVSVDIADCSHVTALPATWPDTLQHISVRNCSRLAQLPHGWPPALTQLMLLTCKSIVALPTVWSSRLTDVTLSDCVALTALPELWPPLLGKLTLCNCVASTAFCWPSRLQTLHIGGDWLHGPLPPLLASLVGDINTEVTWRADALQHLTFSSVSPLTRIMRWPLLLTELQLCDLAGLEELPTMWPAGLTRLVLRNLPNLIADLPTMWPEHLVSLELSALHVCAMPTTLRDLRLHDMYELPTSWPPHLVCLELVDINATPLPVEWPAQLKTLSLEQVDGDDSQLWSAPWPARRTAPGCCRGPTFPAWAV